MIGQRQQVAVLRLVPAQEVLQRCRREEDLLPEPQLVAGGRGVVGVEHARDRLEAHPVGERAHVIALVEVFHRQRVGRTRRPQAQRVHVRAAPPGDRRVIRHGLYALGRMPHRAGCAVGIGDDLHPPAEPDGVGNLRPRELPRVPGGQPILRKLDLPAVPQALPEDAVVVANAVPVRRNAQRRQALHVARRKPAEAAIAKRRVRLELPQAVEVHAEVGERGIGDVGEAEVAERVAHQASGEELEGEVVDALGSLAIGALGRVHPVFDDAIAHGQRRRQQPVVIEGVLRILADEVGELGDDGVLERGDDFGGGRGVAGGEDLGVIEAGGHGKARVFGDAAVA